MDRMLIVYVAEESADARRSTCRCSTTASSRSTRSARRADARADPRAGPRRTSTATSDDLLEHLGVDDAQEEVLINGITKSCVVGKVRRHVEDGVVQHLRSRDPRALRRLRAPARRRLQQGVAAPRARVPPRRRGAPPPARRLRGSATSPRARRRSASSTSTSRASRACPRQVLKTPAKVAELVEEWSNDAVDLVWKHGGVFDKMVGDCVIALFGPPFYEETPGERLARAIQCAMDIRAMTNEFPKRVGVRGAARGRARVSTGVNLAPLFVGSFGPNSQLHGLLERHEQHGAPPGLRHAQRDPRHGRGDRGAARRAIRSRSASRARCR